MIAITSNDYIMDRERVILMPHRKAQHLSQLVYMISCGWLRGVSIWTHHHPSLTTTRHIDKLWPMFCLLMWHKNFTEENFGLNIPQ